MSSRPDRLASLIAAPLRIGTYVAIAVIGLGLALSFGSEADPARPPEVPFIETVGGGGAQAIIVTGLVLLSCVPVAGLLGALVGFARERERRYVVTTAAVLVLLPVSLVLFAALVT